MDSLHLCFLLSGRIYDHVSNGSRYKCLEARPGYNAVLERVSDKWTFEANDTYADGDGKICWGYSTGGHWPDGYPKFEKEGNQHEMVGRKSQAAP